LKELTKEYYPNILVALQFGIIIIMIFFTRNFFDSIFAIMIFIIGAIVGIWALQHNQLGNFNVQPKLKDNAKLITTGIYSYIRHPMYLSVIIMMFSTVFASSTLLEFFLFLVLIFVLWLKARREENLWSLHNENYKLYIERTKLFLPFIL